MASSAPPSLIRDRQRGKRPRRRSFWSQPRSSGRRVILVWGILMLCILALIVKLSRLQIVQASALQSLAQMQRQISFAPKPSRRPIIDRQGNVLAVDRIVYTLYVHPLLFKQSKRSIAQPLSLLLEQPVEELLHQFNQQATGIKVKADIPEELADRIAQLHFDGVDLIPNQQRFYPRQDLLAHVVGYVDMEGEGQAGLEYGLQKQLLFPKLALAPSQTQNPNSAGADDTPIDALADNSLAYDNLQLQLTLDSRLQRVAQRNLRQKLQEYGAKRGVVMVMDVQDGALLAMVSEPTFNPNRYYEAKVEWFKNWAVTDLYEPGSTFKPINLAIAMESVNLRPDDIVNDEGRIYIGKWPIQNFDYSAVGGRGALTITDVLKYSSNVGMVRVMELLKPSVYYDWLERCGLGKPTGIELPAEATAQLKSREQFINTRVEPATTAFGQGFSITPIQLLQLQAAIANGGKLVTPHVTQGLVDETGVVRWSPERPAPKTLFSPKNTQQVLGMMEQVVVNGMGKLAKVPGYRIAGKTGTAQKVKTNGGYGDSRITSFVGVVPVEAPRYVVLAVIDDPLGENAYGGSVTAPIVKSVIESLVVIEGLAPSE